MVALTSTGDNALPRLPPTGPVITWVEGAPGHRSVVATRLTRPTMHLPISDTTGDHANPTTTRLGTTIVWDTDVGAASRSVVRDVRGFETRLVPLVGKNPAITGLGTRVYFESTEDVDLYNPNPANAQQIFHWFKDGSVKQVSRGMGTSRNPAAPRTNGLVVFDSTSDPVDGHDTGVAQIWVADAYPFIAVANAITSGAGDSELPQLSLGGEVVVFQSRAALATDGHYTGVSQIFLYVPGSQTYAQLTQHPAGCVSPTVHRIGTNFRVAYTCAGHPFLYDTATDQQSTLPLPSGAHTTRAVVGLGTWFLELATTADLTVSGLTPDHQLYIVNLYKRPAQPMAGPPAVWFPFRGL